MMARRRRRGYCRTGRESRVGVMTDDDDDGVASASGLTISRRVGVWAHYLASRRLPGSLSLCLASLSLCFLSFFFSFAFHFLR